MDHAGTTNFNFAVGQGRILGTNNSTITFGSAIDLQPVNGNTVGATSVLPDAVHAYIPEPSALSLLGVVAPGMLTRRRHA